MTRKWDSVFFTGLLLLAFVLVVLFYHPYNETREAYISIDTNLKATESQVQIVKLKLSLNEQQHLDDFPTQIGDYQGTESPDVENVIETLNLKTLIMRTYINKSAWTEPMFLVITLAQKSSSIHKPTACYRSNGYTIIENEPETVYIKDTAITGRIVDSEDTGDGSMLNVVSEKLGISSNSVGIPVQKLIIEKSSNDIVIERRYVLFLFLKDREFPGNEYSLVRVSAQIPVSGDYSATESRVKDFLALVLSEMFEDIRQGDTRVIDMLADLGVPGYTGITLSLLIPVAMIVYPLATRRVFGKRKEVDPVQDDVPDQVTSEDVSTEKVFIPPYDIASKTGNEKILAAYYNSRQIIEAITGTKDTEKLTLRGFYDEVKSSLPNETAMKFLRLIEIAETAMYTAHPPADEIQREATRLSEEIIDELKNQLP